MLMEVTPGCEWVLADEGVPTRKYDGTCVMFDGARWWSRREVKPGKVPPSGFVLVEADEVTGKSMGWEPIEQSGFAKWHALALADAILDQGYGLPAGTYELCGPKVNGNPRGLRRARPDQARRRDEAAVGSVEADTPSDLAWFVRRAGEEGYEGIVWHHPDGRMAKLKAKDVRP